MVFERCHREAEATYTYDLENRIVNVAMTGDGSVAYTYDADGNRVKTVNTPSSGPVVTTGELVDTGSGLSQVVAETNASNVLTALYVRVGDQLLAVMRPGGTAGMWTTHFVHEDALGSVRAMTDEEGNFVDARSYEAFGTKNVETGSEALTYGFAGEALDSTTHLAYHRARWMDSRVGRFAGMDPWAGDNRDPRTLHRYSYVSNSPLNMTDPTGMDEDDGVSGACGDMLAESFTVFGLSATSSGSTTPIDVYLRLFAPWSDFGLGFAGDGRSFTTALDVTSRIKAKVTLQPPDYHVVNQQVWSDPSHVSNWSGTGVRSATATPTMNISSVPGGFFGTNELSIQVAGSKV